MIWTTPRGGHAARRSGFKRRISCHSLGERFLEINFGIGLPDHLWIGRRIHRVYMAATALPPPALAATHTYANPVVAVFLGWLLASEPLTMRVVLASAAILGAIVLIRKGEEAAEPAARPATLRASAKARSVDECAQ